MLDLVGNPEDWFPQCRCISVHQLVTVCHDPYEAARDSYAIVVCTEWDEFKVGIILN